MKQYNKTYYRFCFYLNAQGRPPANCKGSDCQEVEIGHRPTHRALCDCQGTDRVILPQKPKGMLQHCWQPAEAREEDLVTKLMVLTELGVSEGSSCIKGTRWWNPRDPGLASSHKHTQTVTTYKMSSITKLEPTQNDILHPKRKTQQDGRKGAPLYNQTPAPR